MLYNIVLVSTAQQSESDILLFFNRKACLTLYDPMDYSMPCSSVLQHLPEFAQTHAHSFSDAIQLSHLLLPPSPPALSLSQQQGTLFQ